MLDPHSHMNIVIEKGAWGSEGGGYPNQPGTIFTWKVRGLFDKFLTRQKSKITIFILRIFNYNGRLNLSKIIWEFPRKMQNTSWKQVQIQTCTWFHDVVCTNNVKYIMEARALSKMQLRKSVDFLQRGTTSECSVITVDIPRSRATVQGYLHPSRFALVPLPFYSSLPPMALDLNLNTHT